METYLLTLALWFPFHTAMHEGSHAVVAKYCGASIKDFRPYPHKADNVFYFGSVTMENLPNNCNRKVAIAPYVMDAGMFSFGTTYLVANGTESVLNKVITSIFVLAPVIDTGTNLFKYIRLKQGDFKVVIGGKF